MYAGADIVYATGADPVRFSTEQQSERSCSMQTFIYAIFGATMILCVTTTLSLVAMQQVQVDALNQRIKTLDARIAASAEKGDATLASILSQVSTTDGLQYQTQLTEYTLEGIQETYTAVNKLREAFVMLVNIFQAQLSSTRSVSPKKWPLNLTFSEPGNWYNASTKASH
jgi:hypothetical protein